MAKKPDRDEWLTSIQEDIIKQSAEEPDRDGVPSHVVSNLVLSSRMEFRKTMRKKMKVTDVIKKGTPEEKAATIIHDYDLGSLGEERFLTPKQREAIHKTFDPFSGNGGEDEEESFWRYREQDIFKNYIKLYADYKEYVAKIGYVFRAYQIAITTLSKLIDRYEAILRDREIYQFIYDCRLYGTGGDMRYSIERSKASLGNSSPLKKKLSEATPESLIEEFNAAHKGEGVIFRDNVKGKLHKGEIYSGNGVKVNGSLNEDGSGTLVADIDYKGGLYDQIKEQAKECEVRLSDIKAYVEVANEHTEKYSYEQFIPKAMDIINQEMEAEVVSKVQIAPEYHVSYITDKRKRGEEVTPLEEYEAVVPDYNEVEADKDIKAEALKVFTGIRNSPLRNII